MKTCNKCGEEFEYEYNNGILTEVFRELKFLNKLTFVCTNPTCPNYALVQIAMEDMPKE